jgi:hypothetical protein
MSLLCFLALAGCTPADRDAVLANKIEREVVSVRTDVRLGQYARYYAHEQDGSVRAIYVLGGTDAGKSIWRSLEGLPSSADNGCTVLFVRYDVKREKLLNAMCDGYG